MSQATFLSSNPQTIGPSTGDGISYIVGKSCDGNGSVFASFQPPQSSLERRDPCVVFRIDVKGSRALQGRNKVRDKRTVPEKFEPLHAADPKIAFAIFE